VLAVSTWISRGDLNPDTTTKHSNHYLGRPEANDVATPVYVVQLVSDGLGCCACPCGEQLGELAGSLALFRPMPSLWSSIACTSMLFTFFCRSVSEYQRLLPPGSLLFRNLILGRIIPCG
jgi:hypothetical protein